MWPHVAFRRYDRQSTVIHCITLMNNGLILGWSFSVCHVENGNGIETDGNEPFRSLILVYYFK